MVVCDCSNRHFHSFLEIFSTVGRIQLPECCRRGFNLYLVRNEVSWANITPQLLCDYTALQLCDSLSIWIALNVLNSKLIEEHAFFRKQDPIAVRSLIGPCSRKFRKTCHYCSIQAHFAQSPRAFTHNYGSF